MHAHLFSLIKRFLKANIFFQTWVVVSHTLPPPYSRSTTFLLWYRYIGECIMAIATHLRSLLHLCVDDHSDNGLECWFAFSFVTLRGTMAILPGIYCSPCAALLAFCLKGLHCVWLCRWCLEHWFLFLCLSISRSRSSLFRFFINLFFYTNSCLLYRVIYFVWGFKNT